MNQFFFWLSLSLLRCHSIGTGRWINRVVLMTTIQLHDDFGLCREVNLLYGRSVARYVPLLGYPSVHVAGSRWDHDDLFVSEKTGNDSVRA